MTVFRTQRLETVFVRSFKIYILQRFREDDKTDKDFKIRPVITQLNSKFSEVLSNVSEESTDEHMVKFKGRSGIKQYIKLKPIKWSFKLCFFLLE